jgi:hypothetical protein
VSGVCFDPSDRGFRREVRVLKDGKWAQEVVGDGGRVRLMARSGGYVMVRRPRCSPFVLSEKEWAQMPTFDAANPNQGGGRDP